MKTTGNTIFMTGGTSGIGLELARRFRDLGNTVIISGRRKDLLDTIAAEDRIEGIPLDVADPDSIAAAVETVTTQYPDLNVIVTMAGIMLEEDLRDPDHLAASEQVIDINLLGTIRTITAFTPHLLQRTDAVILTISSGLAFVPLVMTPTYNATKAAVHSYTQSLRIQLARFRRTGHRTGPAGRADRPAERRTGPRVDAVGRVRRRGGAAPAGPP